MKTLIIVDVQNDFCPGGSLAIEDGAKIIPIINSLTLSGKFDLVIATQDWHPENHISFASRYGNAFKPFDIVADKIVWPIHCIQGSKGAKLHPLLDQRAINIIVRKGMKVNVDSYSAFADDNKESTGLGNLLSRDIEDPDLIINDIYICGIATDVCVRATVLDAKFILQPVDIYVIEDACAGTSFEATSKTLVDLKDRDIIITNSKEIIND